MPFNKKEYDKKYQEDNKEKIKEQRKKYRENNKDKIKEANKKYIETHKAEKKEYDKKYTQEHKEEKKVYRQTESCKKSNRITRWKQYGVICDDYDELYERYINTKCCELCGVEFVKGDISVNRRCLDHDHETGLFRNVLCCRCNIKRK
jgi:hypothetical protein